MNKVDFTVLIEVINANPNGDPMNGNMPRQTLDDKGFITDVCLKRKVRNRLQDMGENIFMQTSGRENDEYRCLKDRFLGHPEIKKLKDISKNQADKEKAIEIIQSSYIDVRSLGQMLPFKKPKVSIGISASVVIGHAVTTIPVVPVNLKITKSMNSEDPNGKGADTMGDKYVIPYGLYRMNGVVNVNLAKKNGLTEEDVAKIKEALLSLFENDESAARPAGSMHVAKLYWWEHSSESGDCSSYNAYKTLHIDTDKELPTSLDDFTLSLDYEGYKGPKAEILEGF